MRRVNAAVVVGVFLVLLGLLLLLDNLGLLPGGWALVLAVVFALGGLAFVWGYVTEREWWWAAIPGMALVGIAALIAYTSLVPEAAGGVGAGLFFVSLGLGFLLIYARARENWWAVIPGGVMLTLGVVTGLESAVSGLEMGGVFFLGLALTFVAVYLAPNPEGRMTWALIPAAVLAVMGLLILAAAIRLLGYLWPLALILGGAYLLLRTFRGATR